MSDRKMTPEYRAWLLFGRESDAVLAERIRETVERGEDPEVVARMRAEAERIAGIRRARATAERVRQTYRMERTRHAAAERDTRRAEFRDDTRRAAMAEAQRICLRVSSGQCRPALALSLLERIASGLDRVAYDRAVDYVAERFAPGDSAEPEPWRVARSKAAGGSDSDTRRARARSARTDRSGRIPAVRDTRAADPRAVDSTLRPGRWDGETYRWAQGGNAQGRHWFAGRVPEVAEPVGGVAGPVYHLRPIWAVDSAGVCADAAEVLAEPVSPLFGATARSTRATGHYAKRNARTGQIGRALERTVTAPWLGEYRESGPVARARQIGPDSPWRVPSVPASIPPEVAEAARIRSEAHDARLRAEQRAESYRRNGWVHGAAVADPPPRPEAERIYTRQPAAPGAAVCPACRRIHAGECAALLPQ